MTRPTLATTAIGAPSRGPSPARPGRPTTPADHWPAWTDDQRWTIAGPAEADAEGTADFPRPAPADGRPWWSPIPIPGAIDAAGPIGDVDVTDRAGNPTYY